MKLTDLLNGFSPVLQEVKSRFDSYNVELSSQFKKKLVKQITSGKFSKQQIQKIHDCIETGIQYFREGKEATLPPNWKNHRWQSSNPSADSYYGNFHIPPANLHVFWTKYNNEPKVEFTDFGYPK